MRTMPCPACSEIIPEDVDFCPFCGESTRQVAKESLLSEEDQAVADRMAAIAASNTAGDAAPAPTPDQALKLPPAAGQPVCMMCKIELPTVGDYCQKCHDKLELGPEQWDLLKQDQAKSTAIFTGIALIAAIILVVVIIHFVRHH